MTSWFTMPTGREALRTATLEELCQTLSAAHCAAQLLAQECVTGRGRELAWTVLDQIKRAEEALRRAPI